VLTRLPYLLVLAVLLSGARIAHAQELVRVKVEITGLSGDIERNVRLLLPLAIAEEDKQRLPPARIRQLFRSGDHEIALALQPFGLYRPTVRRSLRESPKRWVAHYDIDPGPAVIVRSVDLVFTGEGADAPAFQKARADFPLHPGDSLHHLPYESAKLALIALASDSGYLAAKFDSAAIHVDRVADTAGVVIRFDTGPRYRFGDVTFDQKLLDPHFLYSRVPFKRGDPYQRDKLLHMQQYLADDPYFRVVEVMPHPERAQNLEVPIEVNLGFFPPQAYELGVGYATDNGPRGRAVARFRRLNRRGHHAELELSVSTLQQTLSGRYIIPGVLHPTGALTFLAGYGLLNPQVSSSHTFILEARLTRRRFDWQESISLGWQRTSFTVASDTGAVSMLVGGLSYDRTKSDNNVFPSRGWRARGVVQASGAGLLSDVSFLRLDAGAKVIRSLTPRTRVLVRADAGRVFTTNFHTLPPALRYFTGGDQTIRGYRFESLAPLDAGGNEIGGRVVLAASVESDYRFLERWAIAGFTDAGNATDAFTLHLRQSVGMGLRWISPIGLLRVDAAYTLNPPAYLAGRGRLHFHLVVGPDL
jgi:translocation and assembly module TamA